MSKVLFIIGFCAFLSGTLAAAVQDKCGVCMDANEAYCIDDKSYGFCLNGKPMASGETYTCNTDQFCTNSANICEADGVQNVERVCSGKCNWCSTDPTKRYTCVAKTKFVRCNTGVIDQKVFSCEAGEVCNRDSYELYGKICIPDCAYEFLIDNLVISQTCSNTDVTTTSTIAPVTPDFAELDSKCEQKALSIQQDLFYQSYDATCKKYVMCERVTGTTYAAVLFDCGAKYYDSTNGKCVAEVKNNCPTF